MTIGDERFGPQGSHWGAQINLIGSTVDYLLEARGVKALETIAELDLESAHHVIFELVTRYRIARGDFGGEPDAVVQN